MRITDAGRTAIGALALVVAGFSLGSVTRIELTVEHALALLAGATAALLLAATAGARNGG